MLRRSLKAQLLAGCGPHLTTSCGIRTEHHLRRSAILRNRLTAAHIECRSLAGGKAIECRGQRHSVGAMVLELQPVAATKQRHWDVHKDTVPSVAGRAVNGARRQRGCIVCGERRQGGAAEGVRAHTRPASLNNSVRSVQTWKRASGNCATAALTKGKSVKVSYDGRYLVQGCERLEDSLCNYRGVYHLVFPRCCLTCSLVGDYL